MVPTIGLAFLAGLLSFISPCVLPLVPAYIGYMGGRVTHTVASQQGAAVVRQTASNRFVTLLHGLAFVAGFTFIFVVLGLLATAFVTQIGRSNISLIENLIARAGGVLVIFFGLHFMGVMPALFRRALERPKLIGNAAFSLVFAVLGAALILWATIDILIGLPVLVIFLLWMALGGAFTSPASFWQRTITSIQTALYSDTRRMMAARGEQSFASSAVMGVVFAAGWTPCIGPIYGAILTMAANGGDVGQAGTLLAAYSLGLGIPFLLAALVLDGAQVALRRVQRYMHQIEFVTGAFLIAMGFLIATGTLQQLSTNFAGQFSDLSANIEICVTDFVNGKLPLSQLSSCLNAQTLEQAAAPVASVPTVSAAPTVSATGQAAAPFGKLNTITGLAAEATEDSATSITMGTEVGQRALNFTTQTDDGQSISLTQMRGKVVFLNFWATWCGPCRQEMPTLDRAAAANPDKVAVLAVNNRESKDLIDTFRQQIKVRFPVLMDQTGDIQDLYGVSEYPTTIVVDGTGIIRQRHLGELTEFDIQSLVSQLAA